MMRINHNIRIGAADIGFQRLGFALVRRPNAIDINSPIIIEYTDNIKVSSNEYPKVSHLHQFYRSDVEDEDVKHFLNNIPYSTRTIDKRINTENEQNDNVNAVLGNTQTHNSDFINQTIRDMNKFRNDNVYQDSEFPNNNCSNLKTERINKTKKKTKVSLEKEKKIDKENVKCRVRNRFGPDLNISWLTFTPSFPKDFNKNPNNLKINNKDELLVHHYDDGDYDNDNDDHFYNNKNIKHRLTHTKLPEQKNKKKSKDKKNTVSNDEMQNRVTHHFSILLSFLLGLPSCLDNRSRIQLCNCLEGSCPNVQLEKTLDQYNTEYMDNNNKDDINTSDINNTDMNNGDMNKNISTEWIVHKNRKIDVIILERQVGVLSQQLDSLSKCIAERVKCFFELHFPHEFRPQIIYQTGSQKILIRWLDNVYDQDIVNHNKSINYNLTENPDWNKINPILWGYNNYGLGFDLQSRQIRYFNNNDDDACANYIPPGILPSYNFIHDIQYSNLKCHADNNINASNRKSHARLHSNIIETKFPINHKNNTIPKNITSLLPNNLLYTYNEKDEDHNIDGHKICPIKAINYQFTSDPRIVCFISDESDSILTAGDFALAYSQTPELLDIGAKRIWNKKVADWVVQNILHYSPVCLGVKWKDRWCHETQSDFRYDPSDALAHILYYLANYYLNYNKQLDENIKKKIKEKKKQDRKSSNNKNKNNRPLEENALPKAKQTKRKEINNDNINDNIINSKEKLLKDDDIIEKPKQKIIFRGRGIKPHIIYPKLKNTNNKNKKTTKMDTFINEKYNNVNSNSACIIIDSDEDEENNSNTIIPYLSNTTSTETINHYNHDEIEEFIQSVMTSNT